MKFCFGLSFIDPRTYVEVAQIADSHGWDTAILSDHLINPDVIEAKYPYNEDGSRMWGHSTPWPDVWVASAMMAAVTKNLRFMQSVYVLPMREPFSVAKAVGTLAVMSEYRVSLGFGLGWMRDEFEILGHPFAKRGPRSDEMVEVMRKLWTGELVEHHGRFYDFPPLTMSPGLRGPVPIVVGGVSEAALRRVARLADGWAPAYMTVDQVREGLAKIREYQKEYGREGHPLSVYAACADAFDLDGYRRMDDAGVTHLQASPWLLYSGSTDLKDMVKGATLEQMSDGLRRFADEVIAGM